MRIGGIALDFGTAASASSYGTTMEPFRRGSGTSQFVQLPFVHGVADRGAEFPVLEALAVVTGGVQNTEHGVVGVEQLLAQERQRAPGTSALRPRIPPRRVGLPLG